jgi:DNA-binding MarR family transcriptional regulator
MTTVKKAPGPTSDLVCCGTAMRKASRRLAQLYDEALAPSGLKSTQYAIVVEIGRQQKEPVTMQHLAQLLVMDRSTLGHNLRPLERDGLVVLQPSVEDRRSKRIVLTTAGQAKLREARRHWQKAQDRVHAVFGKGNTDRLRKTLLGIAHDERYVL